MIFIKLDIWTSCLCFQIQRHWWSYSKSQVRRVFMSSVKNFTLCIIYSSTSYGLGSGVFTNDINKIMKVTSALQAGTVWVNCYDVTQNSAPFGGFKRKIYLTLFITRTVYNLVNFELSRIWFWKRTGRIWHSRIHWS